MRTGPVGGHIFGRIGGVGSPEPVQESEYMGHKQRWYRVPALAALVIGVCVLPPSIAHASRYSETRYSETRYSEWHGYVLDHVKTRDKVVFITVDDGSHLSRETNQYIRNMRIPITTFALPEPLNHHRRRFINLLRQTGMTFENHTQTHRTLSTMSYKAQRSEICAGNREVKRVIRRTPEFLRPPGGGWDSDTVRAAKKCGIDRIVLWNVVADYGQIVRSDPGPQLQSGDIVLLHYLDSLPKSLDLVLREARKAGLRPALLRDYLSPTSQMTNQS